MNVQNLDEVIEEVKRRLETRKVFCEKCRNDVKFNLRWDNEQDDMTYECAHCGKDTEDLGLSGEGLNF